MDYMEEGKGQEKGESKMCVTDSVTCEVDFTASMELVRTETILRELIH